jgi:hypothetical protein
MRQMPALRWLALSCLVALVFGPVVWILGPRSDYAVHVGEAAYFLEHGVTRIPLPNFLFAGLTIGVRALLPWLSPMASGMAVGLLAHVGLGAVLLILVQRSLPGSWSGRAGFGALGIVLSLMVLMPINLPTLGERNLYFGYIPLVSYHNPTSILLKPLALLLLVQIVRGLWATDSASILRIAASAGLTSLATLAKPSYTIVLLPALALVMPALWIRSRGSPHGTPGPDWRLLLGGVVAPAVALLAWQYAYTYSSEQATHATFIRSGIGWAPLRVVRMLSPSGLGLKFALSIAFPFCVAVAYFDRVRRCPALGFCWLGFGIGAFYMYFLAETGPRLRDANFIWAAQITLFLLFVASALFLMRRMAHVQETSGRRPDRRPWFCIAVYGLHVASGLVWYVLQTLHFAVRGVPRLHEWF